MVDSFGRVLFTRWDHLQRDERALYGGAFDYSSESSQATYQPGVFSESFPESLSQQGTELGLTFDLFMPWTVNPDGTDLVTLNHVGRHEFSPAALRSREDSNLVDMQIMTSPFGSTLTPVRAGSMMQFSEHSMTKGRLFATDAVFTGLSAGRIVTIMSASPTVNPASMVLRLTAGSGILRDPAVLTNGKLIASVAGGPNLSNSSYGGAPVSGGIPVDPNTMLDSSNPFLIRVSLPPASSITTIFTFPTELATRVSRTAINATADGEIQNFTGVLWQLQPVEVRATSRPVAASTRMEAPERDMFISAGVSPLALKSWMRREDLALLSVRNVTQRDSADLQQPVNLRVEGGVSSIKPDGGPTYSVKALQIVQGEYLRGYTDHTGTPMTGRRIKAASLKTVAGNPAAEGLPAGSAAVAADGSVASLVPARRATCTSCHGVNKTDQSGLMAAQNPPSALRSLLESVRQTAPEVTAASSFQVIAETAYGVSLAADGDDDADGTANLMEWALGRSPVSASDKAPALQFSLTPAATGQNAQFTFQRSRTEARSGLVLETSRDLQQWRAAAAFGEAETLAAEYHMTRTYSADGKTETITVTSAAPLAEGGDRYFRLRATAR
jgi:cytochrome c553